MNHYEYIDIVGKRFSDILGVRNIQDLVSASGPTIGKLGLVKN